MHEVYTLTRFSSRFENPLNDYSMKRKATRKVAHLRCAAGKEKLENIEEVDVALLIENVEVANEIERLFKIIGHGELASRHSRGLGSLLDRAFRCSAAFVDPAQSSANPGAVDIETSIYCNDTFDLQLHNVFRVEDPADRP